jgi:hypothetical protein
VIVAVPVANEVTRPVDDTVANDEFGVAHVTVAPAITAPAASLTLAASRVVSPSDVKLSTVSDSSTLAAV